MALRGDPFEGALGPWGPIPFIGFAVVVAGTGWWLATRWYGSGPTGPKRHFVGGAIAAGAWVLFFAGYVSVLQSRPA